MAKPVLVAVNKVDARGHEAAAAEAYGLGMDPVLPVSAEHGRGVAELIEADESYDTADIAIRRAIGTHGMYSEQHMNAARDMIHVRRRRAAALARVQGGAK